MATVLKSSKISVYNGDRWTTDVEFGRQILNGVNPVVIKRCTELPSNFHVTNEMVKSSLSGGKTLLEEIKVLTFYGTGLLSTHSLLYHCKMHRKDMFTSVT